MKKHSGMRPHDIAVLLKIASKGDEQWLMKDIAYELSISPSEVSESINRSTISGLLSPDKKKLKKLSFLEFLKYGLPYVYPQQLGAIVRGVPTAHSGPPLNEIIISNEPYVWPSGKGTVRGQSIEPLYPKAIEAIEKDNKLYQMLSLIDAIRVGKAREKEIAYQELEKLIVNV